LSESAAYTRPSSGCFPCFCFPSQGCLGSSGRIVLLSFVAAAAVAAVGTFFWILNDASLPNTYWAIPASMVVLTGALYITWKISVYQNAHMVGEKFEICGCSINCLSDP